jgi:hypothetical protein
MWKLRQSAIHRTLVVQKEHLRVFLEIWGSRYICHHRVSKKWCRVEYEMPIGGRMDIVKDMAEQVRMKQAPRSMLKWEEDAVLLVSA